MRLEHRASAERVKYRRVAQYAAAFTLSQAKHRRYLRRCRHYRSIPFSFFFFFFILISSTLFVVGGGEWKGSDTHEKKANFWLLLNVF